METNEIYRLKIIDTNENGVGIARHDGMVVFVPSLVCGDEADVRIVSQEKHYVIGECVSLLIRSEYRCAAFCPSVELCGGCTLSHVSYEYENTIKKNTVIAAFRRAGIPYGIVEDTVCSESRTGYRNKMGVHFSRESGRFGMYREKSNDQIPFEGCVICPGIMSDIVRFTNENTDLLDGDIDEMFIRTSAGDAVTVSLYSDTDADIGRYRDAIMRKFPCVLDVLLNRREKKSSARSYITDRIAGIEMRFSSEAFRQVNGRAFEKLIGIVHEFAAGCDFGCAADLYCGSGIIGLTLAKKFPSARFWGIEINPDGIADAKYNAEANGIGNIEFFCGDAATFGKKIPRDVRPELIVVDPPRAGLSKEMAADLMRLSPERVIYVSCNPQTLARDLARLGSGGYEVKRAVPVNMFPMTRHVETVVLLSKGEVDSKKIRVEFSLEDMDMSEFQDGATYTQIKDYVLEHSGLKVSNLYISQIKRKCGIEVGKNYNLPKSEDSRQPLCPPEKEKAIREAFKYFGMI